MARLRAEQALLLVIDVQEKLAPLIADEARLRTKISTLAQGCALLGVPVVVTEQYPKGLGRTIPELAPVAAAAGGALEKTAFSCAADAGISARLHATGRRTVLLCGIEAHICVLQTALDLLEAGHAVFVVEDATGSRDPIDRAAGLDRARAAGAAPATVEMALFELMRGSHHPRFRDVQRLIK